MIRIACRNDISRIAEIELFVSRYSFKHIFSNDFLYDKLTYEYHKNWISKSFKDMENNCGIEYYVIEDEGIIKGYCSLGFPENIQECELCNIRIDVPFQHNKFGTLLMEHCFELSNNNGVKSIWLKVFEKNTIGIKFYEKLGFKLEGKYFSEEYGIYFLKYKKTILIEYGKTAHNRTVYASGAVAPSAKPQSGADTD